MDEHLLEVYLINTARHTEETPVAEWVSLPTDAETMKAVFERLGVDGSDTEQYDLTATVRAFKASQAMGRAAREPCGGETPLELRQQPSVLSFPFVVISFPMKGGFVSMETTMKKTTSPIVREYKIGDITYIVKAVVKDGAKEDAVTKVRRLIQNDLRGKKVTNNFEPA